MFGLKQVSPNSGATQMKYIKVPLKSFYYFVFITLFLLKKYFLLCAFVL